jgi:hypothetical protein
MHAELPAKVLSFAVLVGLLGAPVILRAETPAPAPKLARDDPNRVICRRESVTGSLAQTRKVCMTRAQWVARARDAQETGQQMQDAGRVNSCGSSTPGAC